MGSQTLFERFKNWIAGIAFKVFLWAIEMDQEEYWRHIYEQEKNNQ